MKIHKKYCLALFLIFLVSGLALLFFFSYGKRGWKVIKSERANLSFEYPTEWPIDFEPEEELKRDHHSYDPKDVNDQFIVEGISFSPKWYRNAGGEQYGFIIVWKQKDIQTLGDYVRYIDQEKTIMYRKIPRPKLEYVTIGGIPGVVETPRGNMAFLDSSDPSLRITTVKNGLVYLFGVTKSDNFMKDEKKNTEIYKKIISTVKFY